MVQQMLSFSWELKLGVLAGGFEQRAKWGFLEMLHQESLGWKIKDRKVSIRWKLSGKYVAHCKSRAADQLSVTRQHRLSAQTYSKQFTRPVSAPHIGHKMSEWSIAVAISSRLHSHASWFNSHPAGNANGRAFATERTVYSRDEEPWLVI